MDVQGNLHEQFVCTHNNQTYDCPGFYQYHYCHPNMVTIEKYGQVPEGMVHVVAMQDVQIHFCDKYEPHEFMFLYLLIKYVWGFTSLSTLYRLYHDG